MSRFQSNQTVASVVADCPRTARVFEERRIDYCCGGKVPIADACARAGVETDVLLSELEAAAGESREPADASFPTASAVVDHVLAVHHAFVHREIPRLSALMEKVNRVHGPTHPETIPPMARIWARVAVELDMHMRKEEEILFPAIRALEGRGTAALHCGLEGPIAVMEYEHEEAGRALARLRELAGDYVPPEDACGSWRALWAGLDEFERDLHVHVHLENNVLFPRVRELAGIPV
jgi:regulator of cell morphogenesis and NO signaling